MVIWACFFLFRGTVKKIIISNPIFLGLADVRPAGSMGFQGGKGPIFLCVSRQYLSSKVVIFGRQDFPSSSSALGAEA